MCLQPGRFHLEMLHVQVPTHYQNTLITQIHVCTYIATQAGRPNSHSMHVTLKYTDANMHRQIHTYVITPVQTYILFTKHMSSACT